MSSIKKEMFVEVAGNFYNLRHVHKISLSRTVYNACTHESKSVVIYYKKGYTQHCLSEEELENFRKTMRSLV